MTPSPNKRLATSILCVALSAALFSGCASSPPSGTGSDRATAKSPQEILADAHDWVTRGCRAYWNKAQDRRRLVCGAYTTIIDNITAMIFAVYQGVVINMTAECVVDISR